MFILKMIRSITLLAAIGVFTGCGGGDDPVGEPLDTLNVSIIGSGTVKAKSGAISCDESGGDCSEVYDAITSEEFTAVPAKGFYFKGWTPPECQGVSASCELEISSLLKGASESNYTLTANSRRLPMRKKPFTPKMHWGK